VPPTAVVSTSRKQVRLGWTNTSADQDGVKIERGQGTGCTSFVRVAQVSGTTTSYVDGGRTRNTTYRYRVRAFNRSGNSPYSTPSRPRRARSVLVSRSGAAPADRNLHEIPRGDHLGEGVTGQAHHARGLRSAQLTPAADA